MGYPRKPSTILDRTADRFEDGTYQWGRHMLLNDKTGAVCAWGGINKTTCGEPRLSYYGATMPGDPAYARAQESLEFVEALLGGDSLPRFNDFTAHGKREVVRKLRAAAKLARRVGR